MSFVQRLLASSARVSIALGAWEERPSYRHKPRRAPGGPRGQPCVVEESRDGPMQRNHAGLTLIALMVVSIM